MSNFTLPYELKAARTVDNSLSSGVKLIVPRLCYIFPSVIINGLKLTGKKEDFNIAGPALI